MEAAIIPGRQSRYGGCLQLLISSGPNKTGEPSPRVHGGGSSGDRWCALAAVLVVLVGCGKLSTRPTGGTVAEPKPQEETKSASAMAPAVSRDLTRVQRRLKELGHDPGAIDGRFGVQTKSALKAFQTDYGLPATGEIDAETRAALGLGKKEPPP